jgi:hypothetical protein
MTGSSGFLREDVDEPKHNGSFSPVGQAPPCLTFGAGVGTLPPCRKIVAQSSTGARFFPDRHFDYLHDNPKKHGLVERVADWPHSSFHR